MKDVNKIILMGRVGADPIQRETRSGLAVVNFPLATSRRLKADAEGGGGGDSPGEGANEETQWHRIVVWGRDAENCAQYVRKGQPLFIEGSVRTRKFEAKDGSSRVAFEVHAENVIFLPAPQGTRVAEAV